MTSTQGMILAVIVIYLIAMILIGVLFNSRGSGSSSSEFFIGGRKLGNKRLEPDLIDILYRREAQLAAKMMIQ